MYQYLARADVDAIVDHGSPPKPPPVSTLQELLERTGVRRPPALAYTQLGQLTIGDVVVDGDINDYRGVAAREIQVEMAGHAPFPPCVHHAKARIERPRPNRRKVHLIDWSRPIIDRGDRPTLTLATSDFWHSEAIARCVPELQQMIVAGTLPLEGFARRLDIQIVLLTGDNRLVLSQRGKDVRYDPETWCATIGESMDAKADRVSDVLSPYRTVIRGLCERDELNLERLDLNWNAVDMTFVAVCTEWHYLHVNLLAVVHLHQVDYRRILDCFSQGEHTALDSIALELDACLRLVVDGRHRKETGVSTPALPLNPISRFAVLATLLHKMGLEGVIRALKAWPRVGGD
jgi:hypothetical protein